MAINALKVKSIFNWRSRNFINRTNQSKIRIKTETIVNLILSYFGPILISKIEIHYQNLKVIILISGTNQSITTIKQNKIALKLIIEYLSLIFNPRQVELKFVSVASTNLDPHQLARAIELKLSQSQKRNEITTIFDKLKKSINGIELENQFQTGIETGEKPKNSILGIRIERKGLTGKMAMTKKIIKTIGRFKFNSSDSVIDYGFAKSLNKKGIIGVKVWICYAAQ